MTSTAIHQRTNHSRANTPPRLAGRIGRCLSIAPIAGALTLAGCGGSGSHATKPAAVPIHPAPLPVKQDAPAKLASARHAGREITVRQSQYGRILADGTNRTIYLFTRDQGTSSTCYGACSTAWPPVLTNGAPRVGGGLSKPLGTTRRRDGTVQVTYNGHPLYYYVNDVKPGEILCQNVDEFGGTWLIVSPQGTPIR
jgi:predicted lipoprotein with Yx(FWY)xxD motif